MKYILILVLLLIPLSSYAGCEELKAAILNVEKAIEQQSNILSDPAGSEFKRQKAKAEIESLVQLRQTLSEQQCNQGGKDIPVAAAKPAAPATTPAKNTPKPESQRTFKPAGKMY